MDNDRTTVTFTDSDRQDPRLRALENEYGTSEDYICIGDTWTEPSEGRLKNTSRTYARLDYIQRMEAKILRRLAVEEILDGIGARSVS